MALQRGSSCRLGVRRALQQHGGATSSVLGLATTSSSASRATEGDGIVSRRYKSTVPERESGEQSYQQQKQSSERPPNSEMISFPTVDGEGQPVLLNAQEHAVGYLSKILNARVYDVARETRLQEAKNLSNVSQVRITVPWLLDY